MPKKARGDHLSCILIAQNIQQPTRKISEQLHPFPIRSCFGWGLPSQAVARLLVRSYRTFAPLPKNFRRFISVALSLRLPSLDVIQHPALRSSDFPQRASFDILPAITQLTHFLLFGLLL